MGETSIPCSTETRDRLRADKTPGVSWDRYLNDLLDDAQRAVESGDGTDSLEAQLNTIETRTGRIERLLEELQR